MRLQFAILLLLLLSSWGGRPIAWDLPGPDSLQRLWHINERENKKKCPSIAKWRWGFLMAWTMRHPWVYWKLPYKLEYVLKHCNALLDTWGMNTGEHMSLPGRKRLNPNKKTSDIKKEKKYLLKERLYRRCLPQACHLVDLILFGGRVAIWKTTGIGFLEATFWTLDFPSEKNHGNGHMK